jgi:sec-independent protein translocase protein TatC
MPTEAPKFPVLEHVEELRRRLGRCAIALVAGAIVSWGAVDLVLEWLKQPAGAWLPRLAFFSPPDALTAYLKIAVACGLVLSAPVWLHELWGFIAPGLTARERRYGRWFVWGGLSLFVGGVAFGYVVLLPVSLQFLLSFGQGRVEPVIALTNYVSFVTGLLLICGVLFQWPLLVAILARLGLVTAERMRRLWRQALVGMLIVAAIATPTTDITTMLLLVGPMLGLYELSIVLARVVARRRRVDV